MMPPKGGMDTCQMRTVLFSDESFVFLSHADGRTFVK